MKSWKKHIKLFIPGPVEVYPEILKEIGRPMVGHRSQQFKDLFADTIPMLQEVLYTKNDVFLSTSSATGLWEACARNLVKKRALSCMCGAFSDRWHQVTLMNGKEADELKVEWGQAITPEMIDERLSTGEYDVLTFVHSETSTGVANPLYEVAEVMKKYPDVMFCVDAVSSMTGMKIEVDKLGIDVCLASVQKAFALPPGLAVCSVSQKALERAESVENRGYYFDFLTFKKSAGKNNTPTTPSIPQIYGLNRQLERMFEEGLEQRFARHREMAKCVRRWAKENGFEVFPPESYASDTLTCIKNTRGINVAELNKTLMETRSAMISNGYGKLKEVTFRIAHMGDTTVDEIKELLEWIDEIIGG